MLKEKLIECNAVKTGEFTLTSGRKSNFYVDIKKASTNPIILKEIAEQMAPHVNEELIAGMELGAVPIAAAVALETKKPYLIIRKGERKHGTGKQIEGSYKEGQSVVLVEDVTTTGGSSVKSVEILRDAGLNVTRTIVVVDREEGGKEALAELNIELIPLVTKKDIFE